MRSNIFFAVFFLAVNAPVWAAEIPVPAPSTSETSQSDNSPSYSQLITVQVAPFHPESVAVSNGSYTFDYGGGALDSYLVEVGWGARLFGFLGSVYLEENLAVTSFTGSVSPAGSSPQLAGQSLSLYMLGFDTRVMHAWDWFPWHRFIPFVDAGYQYTLYFQSGPSDLDSAQGSFGNPVAGAGFRIWLNQLSSTSTDHVNRFADFPIFLTAKVNHYFPKPGSLNLESTSYFGGLSVGL